MNLMNDEMKDQPHDTHSEKPSKSQVKRDLNALHDLGEQLEKLDESHIKGLELPVPLIEALKEAKSIKTHGARKRHFKYIAGIMRTLEMDEIEAIRAVLNNLKQGSDSNKAQLHAIEMWRDRLIGDDADALTQFLKEYHCDDIQQLRQAIMNARKDRERHKNLGGARTLFRLLRTIIESRQA